MDNDPQNNIDCHNHKIEKYHKELIRDSCLNNPCINY